MTDIINYYSNTDIEEIINNGFDYKLPKETLNIIENLSKKVGAPSYIKTPNFQKKYYNKNSYYKKNKIKGQNFNDSEWETIRNFKATEIKKKEGNDIYIDKIKRCLNKITEDSYPDVRDEILTVIEEITSLYSDDDLLVSVGKIIFTTASQNKFYSKLYAQLYSELKEKIPIIEDIFQKNYVDFIQTFQVIEHVEAEVDYDKFCSVNKENDNRKAMSLFIVYLTHYNMITSNSIISLTKNLVEKFQENIDIKDCKKIVEEICENLFIIITKCDELNIEFENSNEWDSIIEHIHIISKKDADNHPSLTNKVIFKCLDIIEEIQ